METKKPKVIYVADKKKTQLVLSFPQEKLSSGAKLVFLNLLYRLGGKKTCWPSQERIGKDLGLSSRQVRKHLSRLEMQKIIQKVDKNETDENSHHVRSNEYDLSNVLRTKEINQKESE